MQKYILPQVADGIEILEQIPVRIDLSAVMRRLSLHPEAPQDTRVISQLADQVMTSARPRALFKLSTIVKKSSGDLEIAGIEFRNPLLKVNLGQAILVFPYIITCGAEPETLKAQSGSSGFRFSLDLLREAALSNASHYLQDYITQRYNLDYLWSLQPGEMQAWPESGRQLIFSVFSKAVDRIGVRLAEDYVIHPADSACGLFYTAEVEFEGCQICSQEPCMGRRAPYNEELAKKFSDKARRPCGSRVTPPRGVAP